MKKRTFYTILLILSSLTAKGQSLGTEQQTSFIEVDGYAAKVNGTVITRSDVFEALAPMLQEIYRSYQGDELKQELEKAFNTTRDKLIERALIMVAFKKRGGQIPDQYVEGEIQRIIQERFNGDEALFEQALSQQRKTRQEYMDTIREQMSVGMMIHEEITQRVRITPEQVRSEYEKNKDRYFIPEKIKYSIIVLNRGATPEEQAAKREEAEKIRKQLLDGADFNEMAKTVSEGARSAEGGAFPWMQPKDIRPELQETLKTLPAGEISPIITTENELCIVKVEARRNAAYKSFDEVRENIKASLSRKESERLKNRWIERLKKENYVVIYE